MRSVAAYPVVAYIDCDSEYRFDISAFSYPDGWVPRRMLEKGEPSTKRPKWELTQQAFDALLGHLGDTPESAGERFESLRTRLLSFFTYESCAFPDRWADETLDRVAKRISEGAVIESVNAFTSVVARNVLHEARLAERRERNMIGESAVEAGEDREGDFECLSHCLKRLPSETRSLIQGYYGCGFREQAEARQKMAAKLGISIDNLRTRALRIRKDLEVCLTNCRERTFRVTPGRFPTLSNRKELRR
jgi:DNA-directed RNA polymerase specialized sigma24 family protein